MSNPLFSRGLAKISGVLFALFCLVAPVARAQEAPELASQKTALQRVIQALDRVVYKAKKVTAAENYGFMQGGCVFGVMLAPGSSVSETFPLDKGGSYVFIGGGDSTTRDVDILISDSAGRVLKQDTAADASPFVLFEPKQTGTYKMTLRLKSSQSGKAFCAVSVLRTGGAKVPIDRIVQAAVKMVATSAVVFGTAKGGRFNQDPNTWALYGVVLSSKEEAQSDYKRYNAGNRVFIAVGDDRIKDLDLYVLDGNQKVVAGDNQNGQAAAVAYQTKPGNYSIAALNNYSTGPSLVMGILLDLPAGFDINAAFEQMSAPQNSPAMSSLAGTWQGDWDDDSDAQGGTIRFNVGADGALSGQLYNDAVDATVPIAGTLKADGSFFFKYAYAGTSYIAKGNLKKEGDALVARAGFSSDGRTFFSSGTFRVERE